MSLRSSVVIATVLYAAAAASAQVSTPQEPAARPAPAAPAGEVAATPDAETDLGGNPAPVPTERYWLEQGLDRLGVGELPFRVYGWSQVSYTASSTDRFNTPTTFNDRAESFQLQQNWLEVVRSIDTSRAETQYGFRVASILPGYDYKYTQARGMWNDQSSRNGIDTTYVYGEMFLPTLGNKGSTVRVGRWATAIGWEMIEAIATPFVSRSYNFQYNPFTHTGAQVTTDLDGGLTMYHGIVTGADVFFDPAATASYVGGLKWAPAGSSTTVAANVFYTGQGYDQDEAFQHYDSYNVVVTHTIRDGLSYVLDSTFGTTRSTAAGSAAAQWYGFANYLSWTLAPELTANFRAETFTDDDGARTGTSGHYVAGTIGLAWQPEPWLQVRPFARYDRNQNDPFEGKSEMWTGGLDVIVRW
jgi:hypothetical protein